MCGIVGIITCMKNGFTHKEGAMFADMLFVDTLRGWDSTGVFGVSRNNNVLIHKEASAGPDFIQTKEFVDFKTKLIFEGSFAVGHNRAATRGTVKDENAHPFWVNDKIILVQNGTYRGEHKHLKDTEVDTEAVAHVIAEENDVAKALQKINAAYALVWYNTENKTLHLIRNSERPLYVGVAKSGTIMFASEYATIAWAAHRNDVPFETAPEMLTPNTLLTYQLDSQGNHTQKEETIDCNYVYSGPTWTNPNKGRSFRNWPYTGEYDSEYATYKLPEKDDPNPSRVIGNPPNTVEYINKVGKPDDMSVTMSGQLMDKLHEFHMTIVDTDEFEGRLKARLARGESKMTIELIDYIKGNKHDQCSSFIVFGKALDPMLADGPQPVYHWLVYGKEEHDVFNLCTQNPFFEVTLTAVNKTYFKDDKTSTRKGIITCFVTNPQPLQIAVESATKVMTNASLH